MSDLPHFSKAPMHIQIGSPCKQRTKGFFDCNLSCLCMLLLSIRIWLLLDNYAKQPSEVESIWIGRSQKQDSCRFEAW